MLEKISDRIVDLWVKKSIIDGSYKRVYSYGVTLLLSSLIGASIILILGTVFLSVLHALVFLASFIPIRFYFGGYHAKSFVTCNLTSTIVFSVVMAMAHYVGITPVSIPIIGVISILLCLVLAPVENKHKPLDADTKKKCRLVSLVLLTLGFTISILAYNSSADISAMITYTLLAVVVLAIIGQITILTERRTKT